jgi:toxin FitB
VIYLFDTNVVCEVYKPRPHPQAAAWVDGKEMTSIYLTTITLGEIERGIEKKRGEPHYVVHVARIAASFERIKTGFAGRILSFDATAAQLWGRLTAHYPNHAVDAQIAAIAMAYQATLVTRDGAFAEIAETADALGLRLSLVNPFVIKAP